MAGNAFRLVQFALAHNLLRLLGSKLCRTVLKGASIKTRRTRLLKVGARIAESLRRVRAQIAGGFPLREVLALVLERIARMPGRAAPAPARQPGRDGYVLVGNRPGTRPPRPGGKDG